MPLVTNPRGAASVDKIEAAIGEWDTNCRLFAEADGPAQDEQSRRISLVSMLPKEINAHISMHWDLPEYRTYHRSKKYIIKYVKTIINLNKSIKPVHAVVPQQEAEPPPELPMTEEDEAAQAALMERLVHTEDPAERAEICAVMRNRGFRAPTRGQGGQRQRTTTTRYMPPRDRNDITCVNCGKAGHTAPNCSEAQKDKKDRPCFGCGKPGHESRNCPDKAKRAPPRRPVKAVDEVPAVQPIAAVTARPPAAVLCITSMDTSTRVPTLGDYIVSTAGKTTGKHGKYRTMTLADIRDPIVVESGRFAALADDAKELKPKKFSIEQKQFPSLSGGGEGDEVVTALKISSPPSTPTSAAAPTAVSPSVPTPAAAPPPISLPSLSTILTAATAIMEQNDHNIAATGHGYSKLGAKRIDGVGELDCWRVDWSRHGGVGVGQDRTERRGRSEDRRVITSSSVARDIGHGGDHAWAWGDAGTLGMGEIILREWAIFMKI